MMKEPRGQPKQHIQRYQAIQVYNQRPASPATTFRSPIFPMHHKHNIHYRRRSSPRRIPTSEVFTSFSPTTRPTSSGNSSNNKMARKYASRTTTQRRGLFRRKVHHQKRHATLGDKIAGGLKKLKGTLTRNPAVKVRYLPPLKTLRLSPSPCRVVDQLANHACNTGCWHSPHARY